MEVSDGVRRVNGTDGGDTLGKPSSSDKLIEHASATGAHDVFGNDHLRPQPVDNPRRNDLAGAQ
eukprot:1623839-Pyramimonas_sp.AAC.1